MSEKPVRRKFTPCWVVVRISEEENAHPHVLAVFEYLEQAEVYAEKCNDEYKSRELPLITQIQPADYCHF
jgi:hypothetical protein